MPGRLHGALFFNVAGIGFDARIASTSPMPGARRGLLGYATITFGELRAIGPGDYAIRVNGGTCDRLSRAVHRAGQLASVRQRRADRAAALLDDGHLDLVVVEAQPLWRLLEQVPAFFRGTLVRDGRLAR